MSQYLESLHNSVNQYFTNDQCHKSMYRSIQSTRKTRDFNLTEDEKFINTISEFVLPLTLKEILLHFGVVSKKNI